MDIIILCVRLMRGRKCCFDCLHYIKRAGSHLLGKVINSHVRVTGLYDWNNAANSVLSCDVAVVRLQLRGQRMVVPRALYRTIHKDCQLASACTESHKHIGAVKG